MNAIAEPSAGVSIRGIGKDFGTTTALADVDVEIARGSLTSLLGPSGCGKSTLLRIVAGLERADRGSVRIDGIDVASLPPNARDIGVVFQSYALFPHLDVAANVGFALSVRRLPRERIARRVEELLALVQLPGFASRYPHELSGGQRQRVALARALAATPKLLLLDEPFAALDLAVRKELRNALHALHETTGVTTILVTHDPEEAMELSDALVVLRDGRVEQTGQPATLYREPINPFVMRFLGPVSILEDEAGSAAYVRPEDFRIEARRFAGGREAVVERVVHLGAHLRLDVRLSDGQLLRAHARDERAQELAASPGRVVYIRALRSRPFDEGFVAGAGV